MGTDMTETRQGEEASRFEHDDAVHSVAFSPDGRTRSELMQVECCSQKGHTPDWRKP